MKLNQPVLPPWQREITKHIKQPEQSPDRKSKILHYVEIQGTAETRAGTDLAEKENEAKKVEAVDEVADMEDLIFTSQVHRIIFKLTVINNGPYHINKIDYDPLSQYLHRSSQSSQHQANCQGRWNTKLEQRSDTGFQGEFMAQIKFCSMVASVPVKENPNGLVDSSETLHFFYLRNFSILTKR